MSELPSSQAGSVSEADLYEDWSAHPIKVGEFIINFNERYAEAPDGEKRNITPNSIKLLLLLLHNSSSYVSLSDIHKFVYGNQYKDDSSTRKQVTSLRKLFDDTAKEKHYIENKLGHGYRLVAPVEFIDEESVEIPDRQESNRVVFKKVFWALVLIVVLAVSLLIYISLYSKQESSRSLDYLLAKPTPITHLKGLELYPSLSPNEKWMLFTHRTEGEKKWKIYVRDMQTGELINLTQANHSERMARWSSDNQIVYSRFEGENCFFYLSTFDPITKTLLDESRLVECNISSEFAQGQLWLDKQGMFFNKAESINAPFIIYSHSFLNDESWPIASPPPSGKGDYYFSLSADGTKLAVLRNKNWSQTEVWIYDTTSWETQLVDSVNSILHTVSWSGNSSVVYRNDANQIIQYNLNEKNKVILAQPLVPVLSPLVLKSGKTIFAGGSPFKKDLYSQLLSNGDVRSLESSSYHDIIPAISKDGKQLAWASNRTGVFQVWLKKDGERPKQVTHLVNNLQFVDLSFSPDGSAVGGTASGRWFVIDLETMSVKWASDESYYTNFQWRKNSNQAFLAMKHMEQWEQVILDLDKWEVRQANIPLDAFIVLEDLKEELLYIASFKKNGFWRVKDNNYSKREFFEVDEIINTTGRWSLVDDGVLFTANEKLYFLPKSASKFELLEVKLRGKWISSPLQKSWIVTTDITEGEMDLMQMDYVR
ncbi:winged helix-turn-helix domain-containing protein [Pleionea mediterranea]|uniref:DNA-binding winged helix-turn-helix (WHTH) protein n=1 Tax=Pleionea mediterranea TaxID=523701 RepID=A0A316G0T7_9GAMM|nr:winged helix-turn-helix domain-containing protein [Pleionea mediterranea]PWK54272.1 DNA-binding winged helix-turn-helix (wHTH) protein [Pleionea mediterranea]